MDYQKINAKIIDDWCDDGWRWGQTIDHETYMRAKEGDWDVHLTTYRYVPHDWFGDLNDKKVLGLASGGGQQMPIFASQGAHCTLFDISNRQCANDDYVAKREGYKIDIINGDMTKRFPFADESFDLIFHPVSNCYIRDVLPVFKECYRVLKKGGRLLGGYTLEADYALDEKNQKFIYKMPFEPLNDKRQYEDSLKYDWGIAFSHTISEQIGSQIKAGFRIADIYDDLASEGILHDLNIKTFIAVLAIKD